MAALLSETWQQQCPSPTTEIPLNAAEDEEDEDFDASRRCSLGYLAATVVAASILAYGLVVLYAFCEVHIRLYRSKLVVPYPLLYRLGSLGYDDATDRQWVGFTVQYPRFLALALFLGGATWLHRRALSRYAAASRANEAPLSFPISVEVPAEVQHHFREQQAPQRGMSRLRSFCCHSLSPRRLFQVFTASLLAGKTLPTLYTMAGVGLLAVAHGPHFFLPLLIMSANYALFTRLQRWCPYRVFMAIMWVTHVALLYIIEVREGFEMTYWLQYYFTSRVQSARQVLGYEQHPRWRQRMRWYVAYRMTMLRMIAFNYDLWEATHGATRARERAMEKHDSTCVECAQLREQNAAHVPPLPAEASCCYKFRTEYARDAADYNFVHYAAYLLFPPLYLAGPMLSFNAFVSYMRVPSTSMPPRKMALYILSILRIYATEVLLLHFVYLPTIAKETQLVVEMNVTELAYFCLYSLAYTWLKFIFIWRSSRLFALLSGIETPEDMRRCFANTLTVRDFWRDWHASFNLWIVRYMYIPMGGRSRVALSVLPIFLFIAMWHDPALHLIKWALCIAFVFLAEFFVSAWFAWVSGVFRRERASASSSPQGNRVAVLKDEDHNVAATLHWGGIAQLVRFIGRHVSACWQARLYYQLRVLGGIASISGLIVANLVGFSLHSRDVVVLKNKVVVAPIRIEDVMANALGRLTLSFTVGLLLSLYVFASLTVRDRDLTAQTEARLKRRYGLNANSKLPRTRWR